MTATPHPIPQTRPGAGLPPLESAYPVSQAEREAYQRDGHIVLSGVASPEELAGFVPAILAASQAHNTESRPLAERDHYGQAFLQTMNLWEVDETVRRFVFAPRFAGIAAQLLGVERVRIYHDQALFKEPGGGVTPWHQDAGYWPLDGERCITMWLPLQAVDPAMGSLQFASGSNVGDLGNLVISEHSERVFAEQSRYPVTQPATLALGDASFHGGWTAHRALANTTDQLRAVMTVIWYADGLEIDPHVRETARSDLARWLPGCDPGDLAASPLNPVLSGA